MVNYIRIAEEGQQQRKPKGRDAHAYARRDANTPEDAAWKAFILQMKISTGRCTPEEYKQYLDIGKDGNRVTAEVHATIAWVYDMDDAASRARVVSDAILTKRGKEKLREIFPGVLEMVEKMGPREREYFIRLAYTSEKGERGS